jgi:hypothetical protein
MRSGDYPILASELPLIEFPPNCAVRSTPLGHNCQSNLARSSLISFDVLDWKAACTLFRKMSQTLTSRQKAHNDLSRRYITEPDLGRSLDSRTINLEFSLAADTRRIFEALTVPEYMELWISLPGDHPDCCTRANRRTDGFVCEHLCGGRSKVTISGAYSVFLRRKLVFSWTISGLSSTAASLADLRLCGDFERSILRLRHFGFTSDEDYSWHTALWTASLTRLSGLLGGPANGPRPHGSRGRQRRPVNSIV